MANTIRILFKSEVPPSTKFGDKWCVGLFLVSFLSIPNAPLLVYIWQRASWNIYTERKFT